MNERGALRDLLQGYEEETPMADCAVCGGFGIINCTWCQGREKVKVLGYYSSFFVLIRLVK